MPFSDDSTDAGGFGVQADTNERSELLASSREGLTSGPVGRRRLSLRLPPEVYERLMAIAKAEGDSIEQAAAALLERSLRSGGYSD